MADEDETVNYQSGKVKAISQVGETVEKYAEASDEDTKLAYANAKSLQALLQQVIAYQTRLKQDQQAGRIPLKESTYMLKGVDECVKIIKQQFHATEIGAIKLEGATHALREAVKSIKRIYDEEMQKKANFIEFSSQDPQDEKQRPVGYPPKQKVARKRKKSTS